MKINHTEKENEASEKNEYGGTRNSKIPEVRILKTRQDGLAGYLNEKIL